MLYLSQGSCELLRSFLFRHLQPRCVPVRSFLPTEGHGAAAPSLTLLSIIYSSIKLKYSSSPDPCLLLDLPSNAGLYSFSHAPIRLIRSRSVGASHSGFHVLLSVRVSLTLSIVAGTTPPSSSWASSPLSGNAADRSAEPAPSLTPPLVRTGNGGAGSLGALEAVVSVVPAVPSSCSFSALGSAAPRCLLRTPHSQMARKAMMVAAMPQTMPPTMAPTFTLDEMAEAEVPLAMEPAEAAAGVDDAVCAGVLAVLCVAEPKVMGGEEVVITVDGAAMLMLVVGAPLGAGSEVGAGLAAHVTAALELSKLQLNFGLKARCFWPLPSKYTRFPCPR